MGTIAFLLTDVEGSTPRWETEPDAMALAMERHYELMDDAICAHGGVRPQEQGEGDSVVAAFSRVSDAVRAAMDAQVALRAESWPTSRPLAVRMAIHAGEARLRDEVNYAGIAIIRAARLRAIGHGGQILVSQAARDMAMDQLGTGVSFADLGVHPLKGLTRAEHVWQVEVPDADGTFEPLVVDAPRPSNLPSFLSSFVGRADEVAAVARLLDADRVVTLAGAGGSGKTRLAVESAAQVRDRFVDGVWWVDLARVERSDGVVVAIGDTLGVSDDASSDPLPRLTRRLATRSTLLVIDNAEHVVDEVARVVEALVLACPHLRLLITSRTALDIPGEVTWRVPLLECPPLVGRPDAIDALTRFEAVALFVDRARRVRSGFTLTDVSVIDVTEICTRLDGMPLAIELAAARCRSLSTHEIRNGLDDALRLLSRGSRTALPRQQTLEASITWSHDLLSDAQRTVLRRLSVFVGGWTLAAAAVVVADGDVITGSDVADLLDALERQSLVQVDDEPSGAVRYRMLETVRQYAARQLHDAGETDAARARQAAWSVSFLTELGAWAQDERVFDIWTVLEHEMANVDAAMAESVRSGETVAMADAVYGLTEWFAYICRYAIPLRWLGDLLAEPTAAPALQRARLLTMRAYFASVGGHYEMAIASVSEAFGLGMELADERVISGVKNLIALGGAIRNDPAGRAMAEETLEVGRAIGDWEIQWGATYALAGFGASLGRPLESVQQMTNLRALTAIGPPARQTALLLLEGTQARMEGRTRDSLDHYGQLDSVCRRGGALHQTAARGGHALSAFAAGVADPDEGRLEQLRNEAIADGDDQGTTLLHTRIGLVALRLGEFAAARAAFDAAIGLMPDTTWARWADAGLVAACIALGEPTAASAAIERLRRSEQPLRLVIADLGAAAILIDGGEPLMADAAATTALTAAVEHGLIGEVPGCLETRAETASLLGQHRFAGVLMGAARRLREERELHGRYLPTNGHLAATADRLQAALGHEDFDDALTQGAGLTWPDAVAYAERGP